MNFKRVFGVALSATMLVTMLGGCGSAAGKKAGKSSQSTITFWHNYSAESKESKVLKEKLIPEFEKEHPEYKVKAVSYSWEDLHNKILIGANSKKLPDVARLDIAWVPEFQKMNILVPLNKEMSDFQEVSDSLLSNSMNTAKIGDDYYAIGLNTNSKILFYNKEVFDKAGLEEPKTLDEMYEDAAKLSGKDSNGQQVWGLDEPALAGWNTLPYIWSYGGKITDENYTKASGYLNSAETVQAVQKLADLYKNKSFTGFNSGDIPMTDGFGTGRYAMIVEGPWKIAEMKGAYPNFKYGTCALPAGKSGSVSVLGGEDIGMFQNGNKKGAWEFMKFMTSKDAEVAMAECGQIPANKEALDTDTVKNSDFAPFLQAIETAGVRPAVAKWTEIDNQMTTAMTSIIKDGADAQKTLDELAPKVDKLLQE